MNEFELNIKYEAINADTQSLQTNFSEIKAQVIAQVERYSIDVTDENLPEAKKVMANFNKVKTEIGERYKFYIDKLSAPINQLKDEKKQIESIISEGRQKIADEVANFENVKLEKITQSINEYVKEICELKGLDSERINTSELIKLSAITATGTLAKATKEAIDTKITALENEILQAKLAEQERLEKERAIAEQARKEAQEKAELEKAQLQAKAAQREAELKEQMEREKAQAIKEARQEVLNAAQPISTPKEPPRPSDDGKAIYTIKATFEVKAPHNASHDKLKEKIAQMLANAGITNCINLEVLNA